jgi:hypothetical protein
MTDEVRNRKNMWMYEMSNKCIKCGRYGHVAANCNVMSLNPLKCSLLHSEPNRVDLMLLKGKPNVVEEEEETEELVEDE